MCFLNQRCSFALFAEYLSRGFVVKSYRERISKEEKRKRRNHTRQIRSLASAETWYQPFSSGKSYIPFRIHSYKL